jgi:hypothetical protein
VPILSIYINIGDLIKTLEELKRTYPDEMEEHRNEVAAEIIHNLEKYLPSKPTTPDPNRRQSFKPCNTRT